MPVSIFRGLNNVTDPMRLGLGWLVQADNVHITDTGGIAKRQGHSRFLAGAFSGAFTTFDFGRMYVVDNGALKSISETGGADVLATGLSVWPMHWAEINDQVYFNNGVDSGVIQPDNTVVEWRWAAPAAPSLAAVTGSLPPGIYQVRCTFTLSDGRHTGAGASAEIALVEGQGLQIANIPQKAGAKTNVYIAPSDTQVYQLAASTAQTAMVWNASADELGADLLDTFNDPLPLGADVIQFWKGQAFAAQYFPAAGHSAVWMSQPLGFHLFDLNRGFFLVPGRVLMLALHDDALIVGTDLRVFTYDGKELTQIADYGVVPGWHWSNDSTPDGRRTLFWTVRGLCSALPFKNLTERQISVAPGASAGGTVVHDGGQKRYLVALRQSGSAFNSYP